MKGNLIQMQKRFRYSILIFLAALFFVGCKLGDAFPTRENSSPGIPAAFTSTITSVPQIITPSPTLMPTTAPRSTAAPNPTFALQPTLSTQDVEKVVLELLKTNADCQLPCFWGITARKTDYRSVMSEFSSFGRNGYAGTHKSENMIYYETSFVFTSSKLTTTIVLNIDKDLVQKIEVYVGGLSFPETAFEDWEPYTLRGILQGYGTPTKVLFSVQLPPESSANPSQALYSYALYYQAAEMFIAYSQAGPIEPEDEYILCPFKPAEKPDHLNLTLGIRSQGPFRGWDDLTRATAITNQDFYEMFVQGDETTCIAIP